MKKYKPICLDEATRPRANIVDDYIPSISRHGFSINRDSPPPTGRFPCANKPDLLFHINKSTLPKDPDYIRVVCVGDTFGEEIDVPSGDIYIHTGNFTIRDNRTTIYSFVQHLYKLPHPFKIFTSGLQEVPQSCSMSESLLTKKIITALATSTDLYLDGVTTLVKKLRIYSATKATTSPTGENSIEFKPFECYNDIVISHIPPAGILDKNEYNVHVGSEQLLNNLERFPPRVCIFSGEASGHGAMYYKGILCINAGIYQYDRSSLDAWESRDIQYGVPLVVDLLIR